MSGALVAAGVIAAGTAAYAGYAQNQASKKAANAMRNGVQTFDPIEPNAPRTVDWRSAANQANDYNYAHLADQQALAARTNLFNTQQAKWQYQKFQPYFDTLQSQIGKNALSYSRGELPADVVQSLGQAASTRGLSSGFGLGARGAGGGTALGNSLLRGLGLTSLDLSKFGTQLGMNVNAQAKALSPGLYDPTNLMVMPQQAIGYQMQNAQIQNEAARYWNQLQNNALLQNTGAQNQANTNATNAELAGKLAQAQSIQQAGSSIAGIAGNYATNQPSAGGGGNAYIPGAPSGGNVAGYRYNPATGYSLA